MQFVWPRKYSTSQLYTRGPECPSGSICLRGTWSCLTVSKALHDNDKLVGGEEVGDGVQDSDESSGG